MLEQRLQEASLKVARQRRDTADAQDLLLAPTTIAQQADQLIAGRKDGLGVAQRQVTRFRSASGCGLPAQTATAQRLFQLLDLGRQRRLRDAQARRARVRFPSRHGPEVVQVVVVQAVGGTLASPSFIQTERYLKIFEFFRITGGRHPGPMSHSPHYTEGA